MMKKLILSTGIFLFAFLAYSQESDGPGSTAGLSVISRLDLDPAYSGADNTLGFSHGNSCIYTLFEGSASEHFSGSMGGDTAQPAAASAAASPPPPPPAPLGGIDPQTIARYLPLLQELTRD